VSTVILCSLPVSVRVLACLHLIYLPISSRHIIVLSNFAYLVRPGPFCHLGVKC
jgi:hypothetical protein